ncbi:unnamed protein product [Acanthoscelides obtectus]|uniref:Uncharacterized protein n=1 Tax=Acanthoscelides obtectus TaxID=200917 RepID=A0A9P0LFG5_ACAOB|nr:unnamed protein product [Acanthoscelides obtectus]CAK1660010.1 hypothetical protein AOBTE_LOCUS21810 [Acanthoscelides obtectus]
MFPGLFGPLQQLQLRLVAVVFYFLILLLLENLSYQSILLGSMFCWSKVL